MGLCTYNVWHYGQQDGNYVKTAVVQNTGQRPVHIKLHNKTKSRLPCVLILKICQCLLEPHAVHPLFQTIMRKLICLL